MSEVVVVHDPTSGDRVARVGGVGPMSGPMCDFCGEDELLPMDDGPVHWHECGCCGEQTAPTFVEYCEDCNGGER